jgi:predicted nucleotidyltransferase
MNAGEEDLRRESLTRNLQLLIEKIRTLCLPASILKVFIHGSYFRGENLPGDLDVVIRART